MDILFFLIIIFCVWSYGVFCGWNAREKHAEKQVNKFIHKIENQIQTEIDNMIPITIERHKDIYYVYDEQTKEFMAQGTSKQEVEKALHARYPDKRFACKHEVLEQVGFIS